MPINAIRHVRKMRGGAQSHLVAADDGNWYVVKFRNNPQHRRVLVNELLCGVLLDYLKIAVPKTTVIDISEDFLAAHPGLHLTVGSRRVPVEPGWHFGSRYPGDPDRIPVYDFLPEGPLAQVVNRWDFLGILAFDKWVGNTDGRQAVFYRAMVHRETSEGSQARAGFVAHMIDHGFAFNGGEWKFSDSGLHGLYPRHAVYDGVRSLADFEPWLAEIHHFPEEVMDLAWRRIPAAWVEGEEDALESLLERLYRRRARVSELIDDCRNARVNPFRNWPA